MPYQLLSHDRFDLIRILGNLPAYMIINVVSKWKGLREKLWGVK